MAKSKDIEVFDMEQLKQSNPNLVRVTEVPDYRKIRSALSLGYDVPGVRKIDPDAPEAPAEEAQPLPQAAPQEAVEPAAHPEVQAEPYQEGQPAEVAPPAGTLVDDQNPY